MSDEFDENLFIPQREVVRRWWFDQRKEVVTVHLLRRRSAQHREDEVGRVVAVLGYTVDIFDCVDLCEICTLSTTSLHHAPDNVGSVRVDANVGDGQVPITCSRFSHTSVLEIQRSAVTDANV